MSSETDHTSNLDWNMTESQRAVPITPSFVPADLIEGLRQDLAYREIGSGLRRLYRHRRLLRTLHPGCAKAAVLMGQLAQWVDVGFDGRALIADLLARFDTSSRAELPFTDYVHLRVADGFAAMWDEDFERAIAHFQFIVSLQEEVTDKGTLAVAHFWIARCHRRNGRYEEALRYAACAVEMAGQAGFGKMASVMRLLESWLVFQKGRPEEARRILAEVEADLATTDDFVSRGNLHSARGRIARREGRYEHAIDCFAKAIHEYERRDSKYRNLARALTNMASVKRLIALEISHKIDEAAASRKKAPVRQRHHMERLRHEALLHLDRASEIFTRYHHHRGLGNARLVSGLLRMDAGELDGAQRDADEAHRLGETKNDDILKARARVLQAMIENAKFEEQIEDDDDPGFHAQRAYELSVEAVECARQTQNSRLLARAYIWQGLILSNDYFNNVDRARHCCEIAADLLNDGGHDYSWNDYQILRKRLARIGSIDAALQEWSQGEVGDKTFQQIAEEFAGIVIPRVWEKEGRKVARVAKRLSISPKKVRRILERQKLK